MKKTFGSLIFTLSIILSSCSALSSQTDYINNSSFSEVNANQNSNIEVRSPAPGSVSFSNPLHLDIRYKNNKHFKDVFIDEQKITFNVKKGPLDNQWIGDINDLKSGNHKITFISSDKKENSYDFRYRTENPIDRINKLADTAVKRFNPENMGWDWGEGLLLYALSRLDEHTAQNRYQSFIKSYFYHHQKKGIPKINWSDRCVPALAALEIYRKTNNPEYKHIAEKVVEYIKNSKKTKNGGLNHLGNNILSYFYPESIWVDSLMMYNIFSARWGKFINDEKMSEFASEQPILFAKVLQNNKTKLWKHAWFVKLKKNNPDDEIYWLRGNGWAMASIPETLDMLPTENSNKNKLIAILNDTAKALLPYQSETGLWYTVLNKPGKIYLETSGTALVSYGMMKGVHQGYLPDSFKGPAEKAYLSLLDRLQEKPEGLSMPEISHNTLPFNFIGYSLVPQKNDLPFGLAALILAGIEYDKGSKAGSEQGYIN